MGHRVLCVDCIGERLDRREVQAVHLGEVLQLIFDASRGIPIGEVQNEREQQRQPEHRDRGIAVLQREHDESGPDRAPEEADPQIPAGAPSRRAHARPLVKCDRERDGERIEQEVRAGRAQQRRSIDLVDRFAAARDRRLQPRDEEQVGGEPHRQRRSGGVEENPLDGRRGVFRARRYEIAKQSTVTATAPAAGRTRPRW